MKIKKKQVQKLIGQPVGPVEYFGGINQEQPSPGTKSNDVDTHKINKNQKNLNP